MKNKRLVIILSVFSFLVLIAVLCSTVFTVKSVDLNWLTTKVNFVDMDNVIVSNVELGESVFLVDKDAIIQKLERKYPYLKVVSAEIKFPNKLVLHIAERQELYSLKIKDNSYAILDADCKVLRMVTDIQLNKMALKPIPLNLVGYSYNDNNFAVSEVAELGWIKNIITNFSVALYQCGYQEIDAKNSISSMTIDVGGYENKISVNMNYKNLSGDGGVTIEIQNISEKLSEKFVMAIGIYDEISPAEKTNGYIRVYMVNGVVDGHYEPEE